MWCVFQFLFEMVVWCELAIAFSMYFIRIQFFFFIIFIRGNKNERQKNGINPRIATIVGSYNLFILIKYL